MVASVELETTAVERLNTPRLKKMSTVSRCLFGRPDRSENQRILTELTEQLNQEATRRWNFDFKAFTPLPGRYDWTESDVRGKTPAEDEADNHDNNDKQHDDLSFCSAARLTAAISTKEEISYGQQGSDSAGVVVGSDSCSTPGHLPMSGFTRMNLKRLTWAPKKKVAHLSCAQRRKLRKSTTITDYFPIRKRIGLNNARRQLKL